MNILKRNFTKLIAVTSIACGFPVGLFAKQKSNKSTKLLNKHINKIANGRKIIANTKSITITINPINSNGFLIPIDISVIYPMAPNNYITSLHILSAGNEKVRIAEIEFSKHNPKAYFSTRVKLEKSAQIVVLVQTSSNKIAKTSKYVSIKEAV